MSICNSADAAEASLLVRHIAGVRKQKGRIAGRTSLDGPEASLQHILHVPKHLGL